MSATLAALATVRLSLAAWERFQDQPERRFDETPDRLLEVTGDTPGEVIEGTFDECE